MVAGLFSRPLRGRALTPAPLPKGEGKYALRAALLLLGALPAGMALAAPELRFDAQLLRGMGLSAQTIERLNQPGTLLPGTYLLELIVNQRFVARMDIPLADNAQGDIVPCLHRETWLRAGVAAEAIQAIDGDCPALDAQVPGSRHALDAGRLRLALSVPQASMQRTPKGMVSVDALDAGASMLFLNYNGHLWHAQRQHGGMSSQQESAFLSLAGGINLGRWQYRQQGHWSAGSGRAPHWHNLRSHLQRPLPDIGSDLAIGQLYTRGYFFSGLAYTGLHLGSDERRLADSQRGFAPVVRGVAASNARIIIRQNGQVLHQTTLAPGAFVIDDLPATSESGDLDVAIEEADGTTRRYRVPFAALPESLRPGHWRYALAAGRTRNMADDRAFADVSYRRGLGNQFSAGAGVRVSPGYQALAADAVYLNRLGAFGLNLNHARSRVGEHSSGWRAGLSWSRTFAHSQTRFGLASWRYSSAGYRELGELARAPRGDAWQARPRTRMSLNLNQSLGRYGQLFVAASAQHGRDAGGHQREWQLGYGRSWANGMSLNLSLMRQRTTQAAGTRADAAGNAVQVSLSMPLGRAAQSSFSSGYRHGSDGDAQYEADLSGSLARVPGLSYHLGASASQQQRMPTVHGNLQHHLPAANVGVSASRSAQHWQVAGNIQGALVVHGGGLTFGPWLGDTFALIHAKGARGARVWGLSRIDRHGYALVPSLMPYRDNRIFLDPQEMAGTVELDGAEQHTAPLPGAAVKLDFHTRRGQALLIHVEPPDAQALPPGTEAFSADGRAVGMLGQGNWLYLRSENARAKLQVRWGEGERCWLSYDASAEPDAPLLRLREKCVNE